MGWCDGTARFLKCLIAGAVGWVAAGKLAGEFGHPAYTGQVKPIPAAEAAGLTLPFVINAQATAQSVAAIV